ncbi:MAG: hypothetical protein ACXV48_05485 [Halobacteriota archaeon]
MLRHCVCFNPVFQATGFEQRLSCPFVENHWTAIHPFVQIKLNAYSGEDQGSHGQTWNFSIALSTSENDSFGRYFETVKEYSDSGFATANSPEIEVGIDYTVFGTVNGI